MNKWIHDCLLLIRMDGAANKPFRLPEKVFHSVETFFPLCEKNRKKFSILWKSPVDRRHAELSCFSKTHRFHSFLLAGHSGPFGNGGQTLFSNRTKWVAEGGKIRKKGEGVAGRAVFCRSVYFSRGGGVDLRAANTYSVETTVASGMLQANNATGSGHGFGDGDGPVRRESG